ncbi:MAG: type II toxin-antitoxin system death-on-curing family toxin [Pseudomonadota bacterium]|nr:type II toxin-antitoxin system death-on-curing family toxin [Pseudomonadota bacterium]
MPTWVSEEIVSAFHAQQLIEHGGLPGSLREGALEAALGRPQNLLAYGDPAPSLMQLAAAYAFALARGHCFTDGNKRVALVTTDVFLQLNGYELTASDSPETVSMFRALASGEITEDQMADWIRLNSKPLTDCPP